MKKKAWALIDAGYDGSFTGTAYGSVFFQNSNNSVRVTDEFMRAVLDDGLWQTKAVTSSEVVDTYRARDLMRAIAEAPGCAATRHAVRHHGQRVAHQPEHGADQRQQPVLGIHVPGRFGLQPRVVEPDDVKEDGEFDVDAFRAACRVMITAQEILVDNSSYPTKAIEKNSHAYRPLGLGYANLGALLMSRGLPYDSDAGRDYAAAITAVMTGEAYAQSARVARDHGGPFAGYEINRDPFLRVMRKHRDAIKDISPRTCRLICWLARSRYGTTPSNSARISAIATRRPPCWRRPAPSAS